jgi:multiple antibiotic resistance protein
MLEWSNIQPIIESSISLFAICDPLGVLPMFCGLTADVEPREQRFMFRMAGVISLVAVMLMSVFGDFVLSSVFHIRFGSFMIGGGIVMLVVAIRSIIGSESARQDNVRSAQSGRTRRESLIARAACPLACPLIVGPGSIVTSMLIVNRHGLGMGMVAILIAFLAVLAVMNWGHLLMKVLGRIGLIIIERILMIFVAAIGAEFIVKGVVELFPQLVGATGK